MLPFLALMMFSMLAAVAFLEPKLVPFLLGIAGLYVVVVAAEALRTSSRTELRLFPCVTFIFPILHFAHAFGFAVGLVRYAGRFTQEDEPERLAVR